MVNYSNGKIYKIEPVSGGEDGDVYIGSTTKKYLSQRMSEHRRAYTSWQKWDKRKTSVYNIFEKYGVDDCQITLIETVDAKSKDELLARESFHIKSVNCVNKIVVGRTRQQYDLVHKDKIDAYNKKYHQDNKDKIHARGVIYREVNKDKINIYREANKDKSYEKIDCDCGVTHTRAHISRHSKSIKHQKYLEGQTL
jgi:hypothetical protein